MFAVGMGILSRLMPVMSKTSMRYMLRLLDHPVSCPSSKHIMLTLYWEVRLPIASIAGNIPIRRGNYVVWLPV